MNISRLILVLAALVFVPAVLGNYRIVSFTIDNNGGGTSKGGHYVLSGAIGQPDAGYYSGGKYELLGGFWAGEPFCVVDYDDLLHFADNWLEIDAALPADFDLNGIVNFRDFTLLSDKWMCLCPHNWPLN